MSPLRLHVLGTLSIDDGETSIHIDRRKAQALLVYLALTGKTHRRDALAVLLWPENDPSHARAELRRNIYTLRKSLGASWLIADTDTVAVQNDAASLWVDALHFRELAAQANPDALRAAADLYHGDLLAGFTLPDAPDFEEWRYFEAESLRRVQASALEQLTRRYVRHGQYDAAIEYARRRLAMDPLHEPAHRELMRLYTWTGQHAAAQRQYEHCRAALEVELRVLPAEETVQLHEQILSGEFASNAPRSAVAQEHHNLPVPPTPFVGRMAQLAHVAELLANLDCRLLTIVGPGGIGKTRLAIRAAQNQVDRHVGGVCYVDLAPVETPDLLAAAMLRALDAPDYGAAEPERRLCEYLRGRELLLVLDNFEHLMAGVDLLPRMLQSAPGIKLLVTSRERLNLLEEWLEPLEGLEAPPGGEEDAPGTIQTAPEAPPDLEEYDATNLFVQCMRRLQPDYASSNEEAAAIATICRLLEGMPLGIELTAAWTRALSPTDMQREVARSLDFLATPLRDVPARHRSMHAVFGHSWSLLSTRERNILRQMSVFRGGCTREAAEAVTGASLANLSQLVDRSWLRPQSSGRYGMHELIRQYCEEKLEAEHLRAAGEAAAAVRQRHCRYYGAFLGEIMPNTNYQPDVIDKLKAEFGNIRAAWQCIAETSDPQVASDLSIAFHFVGDMMGWFGLAIQLLESGVKELQQWLAETHADPRLSDGILQALGFCQNGLLFQYIHLGMVEKARTCAAELSAIAKLYTQTEGKQYWQALAINDESSVLYFEGHSEAAYLNEKKALTLFQNPRFICPLYGQERGQLFWQANAHFVLGSMAWYMGEYSESVRQFRLWETVRDRMGERRYKGIQMREYVKLLLTVGDYSQAEELSGEGLQLSQEFGDRIGIAWGCLSMGRVEAAFRRTGPAREYLQSSLEVGRQTGHLALQMESLSELGRGALHEGRSGDARRCFEEAREIFERLGEPHSNFMVGVWLSLGWIALAEGNLLEAGEMFRKALATGKCAAWEKMEGIAGLAEVAASEGCIEEATEFLSLVVDHPFTAHAMRQQAAQRLGELEHELEPTVFAERIGAGRNLTLESALDVLTAGHAERLDAI